MRRILLVLGVSIGLCSLAPAIAEPLDAGVSIDAPPSDVDAGASAPAAQPQPAPVVYDEANPDTGLIMREAYNAATTGKWKILTGLVLMLLVYATRRWLLGRVAWFKTTIGGIVIAFGLSFAWAISSALATGAALTLALMLHAATNAATAAGLWQWVQKLLPNAGAYTAKPEPSVPA